MFKFAEYATRKIYHSSLSAVVQALSPTFMNHASKNGLTTLSKTKNINIYPNANSVSPPTMLKSSRNTHKCAIILCWERYADLAVGNCLNHWCLLLDSSWLCSLVISSRCCLLKLVFMGLFGVISLFCSWVLVYWKEL